MGTKLPTIMALLCLCFFAGMGCGHGDSTGITDSVGAVESATGFEGTPVGEGNAGIQSSSASGTSFEDGDDLADISDEVRDDFSEDDSEFVIDEGGTIPGFENAVLLDDLSDSTDTVGDNGFEVLRDDDVRADESIDE